MKGSKLKVLRAVVALERFTIADVTGWTGLESSQVIPQIARLQDDGIIERDTESEKTDKPRPAHRPVRNYRISTEASRRRTAFDEIRVLRAAVGEDPSAQRLSIIQGQLEALQRLSKSFRDRSLIAQYQLQLQSIENALDEVTLEVDQEDNELHRRIGALRRFHQELSSAAVPSSQSFFVRPMRVFVGLLTPAEKGFRSRVSMPALTTLTPGLPQTPGHDLIFHGGHTIADLTFANFYVGGAEAWQQSDIASIDLALTAAMSDKALNNVMSQYYPSGNITSTFRGSQVLAGPPPQTVSQGDLENIVKSLFQMGSLNGFDLTSTVLNFMLPSGTILNTDEAPTSGTISARVEQPYVREQVEHRSSTLVSPEKKEEDSTQGLAGYHGSIHVGSGPAAQTIYYAVGAFSETLADGTVNGIPVFDQAWKNVVATFYHQLNEARTDPDVQDAIRTGDDPNAIKFLGWTSHQGEECGDFPVFEASHLSAVFMEVSLTDCSGTVPVQLQYSNLDHGPGEPRDQPAPFAGPLHQNVQQIAG